MGVQLEGCGFESYLHTVPYNTGPDRTGPDKNAFFTQNTGPDKIQSGSGTNTGPDYRIHTVSGIIFLPSRYLLKKFPVPYTIHYGTLLSTRIIVIRYVSFEQ